VRLAITHADSPSGIAQLLEELRKLFGPDQEIPMMECGAVLASHTGLGALAVAVRKLGPGEGVQA
jgi:fatty acid-binding protein DegV